MPTRRGVLAGLGGALLAPWSAGAAPAGRRLVVVVADGGWDPTFALDPKTGLDTVDGPGVDVDPDDPLDVEEVRTIEGIELATNARRRPAVTALFETWGPRACVVNGLWIGALNHQQGLRRVLTGVTADGAPDLAVAAGVSLGRDLPVGAVDLAGFGRLGPHAATALRAGARGQLRGLLDPTTRFPAPDGAGFTRPGFTPDDRDLAAMRATLEARAAADAGRWAGATGEDRVWDRDEASSRAARLRADGPELSAGLGSGDRPGLTDKVDFALQLLAGGVCTAVLLDTAVHWDTHEGHAAQHTSWNTTAAGIHRLMGGLATSGLLEDTVVAVVSEMGRTPMRNVHDGTDHWPTTSAILLGAGVAGGRTCGATDDHVRALPLDLATGAPDPGGELLRYDHLAAGILDLLGVDPAAWFPGVQPFRGAVSG